MEINDGLTTNRISGLAINSSGHIFAGTDVGVFRSTDNGDSWMEINDGLTTTSVLALAINSSGNTFASTYAGGVYRMIHDPLCCSDRVGDVNGIGGDEPSIGDVALLLDALFITNNTDIIPCYPEADVNQSGSLEPTGDDLSIGDVAILIDYLFIGGPGVVILPDCL